MDRTHAQATGLESDENHAAPSAERPGVNMDLEQYGVWVKAGPEDVTDEHEEMFSLSDVADDVDESSFDEERSLTSEEEALLASLEEEEAADDLPDFSNGADIDSSGLDPLAQPPEDSGDFSFSLDDTGEELDETISLDDFSLDDIESQLSDDSFLAEDEPEEALQTDGGGQSQSTESSSDEEFSIDLDDDEFSIDSLESAENGASTDPITGAFGAGHDDLDIDIDSIPSDGEDQLEDLSADDVDMMDADEELPELEIDDEQAFDDVDAVTAAMMGDTSSSVDRHEPLSSIENELASIKSELQALKKELAELRRGGGAVAKPAPVSAATDVEEPEIDTGFFEEDEDETIALTGDELDNILNTAEFTEELGKPSQVDDIEIVLGDTSSSDSTDASTVADEIVLDDLDSMDLDSAIADLDEALMPGDEDEEITIESDYESDDDFSTDLLLQEDEIDLDLDSPLAVSDDLESPAESASVEDSPAAASEMFTGSQEDIDALAELDIDSELAGIEELRDDEDHRPTGTAPDSLEDDLELNLDDIDDDVLELSLDDVEEDDEELFSLDDDDDDDLSVDLDSDTSDDAFLLDTDSVLTPSFQTSDDSDEPEAESLPSELRDEIRSVLKYMDQLLESLPEEKIEEFARSEHFDVYKRLFEELGLES